MCHYFRLLINANKQKKDLVYIFFFTEIFNKVYWALDPYKQ